ncbi:MULTISPECIES: YtxH domain-containing protein [Enterococcus]|uniref:YtxH domain-containing protein n=1 Tax=Candidatus Enterococcus ferrettii TaxID=2815324 RepID=A0ABV0EZH9_9ENTE|nr:YtxH domain-containing protein [Enterococcus sp. 665A]MBO1338745.1 YtxH domain-containing protein [Enterococcus sp. 665A]
MGFFKGLLVGAGVGTIGGLLLAPRRGEETREKLVNDVRDVVQLTDELNDSLTDFRESLVELKATVHTLVPEFKAELESDLEDFKFEAEPRIQQIQEQVALIQSHLPEELQTNGNKQGRFILERPEKFK